jgi:hypothetical protein
LVAGLVWLVLAVAPIPGTTLLGLPFAVYSIVGGALSARERRLAGDGDGMWRARLGAGLGCAGLIYVVAFDLILTSLLVAGVLALMRTALGTHLP